MLYPNFRKAGLKQLLSFVLFSLFLSCGAARSSNGAPVENSETAATRRCPPETCKGPTLWGVGEPIGWNALPGSKQWDVDAQVNQVIALGVPLFRNWGAMSYCAQSPTSLLPECVDPIRRVNARMQEAGVMFIQAEGAPPKWMTPGNDGKFPCRDLTEGSPYMTMMKTWQSTWKMLGSTFTEVNYWQIGNEWNLPETFPAAACKESGSFTFEERVAIAVDLTYYGRQGLKQSSNPTAFAFLGSIAPVDSTGKINIRGIAEYLDAFYRIIESGSAPSRSLRDYFDGVSWHPYVYTTPTVENWVKPNQEIYQVLVSHRDGQVPVWFSEMGNGDFNKSAQSLANGSDLLTAERLSRQYFPWLWGVTWFRMFNDLKSTWGGEIERTYGIMGEPDDGFTWKSSAYAIWSLNQNRLNATKVLRSFEFDDDRFSGFVGAQLKVLEPTGGNLLGVSDANASVTSPTFAMTARDATKIEIVMSVCGGDSTARLLYKTLVTSQFDASRAFEFSVTGDCRPHRYTIVTTDSRAWQGLIRQIQLVPSEKPGQFLIDSIRFFR